MAIDAIYPDDAVVAPNAYATLVGGINTNVSISGVGPYALPNGIVTGFTGCVVISRNDNGAVIPSNTYYLSPAGNSIYFFAGNAPATETYTIRVIDLPPHYRVTSTAPTLLVDTVTYSSSSVNIAGTNYITDGSRRLFSIPESCLGTMNSGAYLLVIKNGVLVDPLQYTYPAPSPLVNNGIYFNTAPEAGSIVEIRATSTIREVAIRLTDMRYRRPSNGYTTQTQFNVAKYSTQAGYEKRRLLTRRGKRSYQLTYTNVTGIEKQAIENFYSARNGEYEAFTFDLTHINQTGTVRCRFNGAIDVQQVVSRGTRLIDNFYTIRFNLQEDF